ncbi:unnamed protein product, partial [marine sediment metagenome]
LNYQVQLDPHLEGHRVDLPVWCLFMEVQTFVVTTLSNRGVKGPLFTSQNTPARVEFLYYFSSKEHKITIEQRIVFLRDFPELQES